MLETKIEWRFSYPAKNLSQVAETNIANKTMPVISKLVFSTILTITSLIY